MSINTHEVYVTCPVCGAVTTEYDYHENTSSERVELLCFLNIGKPSNHLWAGNPADESCFTCPGCKHETPYRIIFTPDYCKVQDLDWYKRLLRSQIQFADRNGKVCFSDWDPDWGEEPALSRLIAMYPEDHELKFIQSLYNTLHICGRRALTKLEVTYGKVSRDMILLPEALEKVYLGDSVVGIAPHTFENCASLHDIFIPDAVTEIGDEAFAGSGLSKVHVSSGLLYLGKRAFAHTQISRFFFPQTIQTIGEECFMDCACLNHLWIPAGVEVGRNAFANCPSLKQIQISESIPKDVVDTWGLSPDCVIERYQ